VYVVCEDVNEGQEVSMATTEELKAAVERLRALQVDYDYEGVYGSVYDKAKEQLHIDRFIASEAYVNHITEQEAIAAGRALPITEEWLVSIGGKESNDSTIAVQFEDTVLVNRWGFDVIVCNARPDLKTRGEVLDLLAALKIETKGV